MHAGLEHQGAKSRRIWDGCPRSDANNPRVAYHGLRKDWIRKQGDGMDRCVTRHRVNRRIVIIHLTVDVDHHLARILNREIDFPTLQK